MTLDEWTQKAKLLYSTDGLITSICPICPESQVTEIRTTKQSAEMAARSKVKTHIHATHKDCIDDPKPDA